jgi:hypothetical protein
LLPCSGVVEFFEVEDLEVEGLLLECLWI